MKIILKESQYRKILIEERKISVKNKMKELEEFFLNLVENIKNQIGLDISFLMTWGATISGFAKPVSDFIQNKYEGISNDNLVLMTVGLILTYYQSNKEMLKKVLNKIKEDGLVTEFESMLSVGERLRKTFVSFIESLAIPMLKYSNILAYTFIIPILGDLLSMVTNDPTSINPNEIVKRIIGYISINLGGDLISRVLIAIVKRFKS
jgi:hypothetical protein